MKIGVVVGRFQVDRPHEGHRYLLNEVQRRNDHLVIVLGCGPLPTTCRKPLSFYTRKAILQRLYPEATILRLDDHPDDNTWVKNLDKLIDSCLPKQDTVIALGSVLPGFQPESKVTFYCSRDSFSEIYNGKYTVEVMDDADLGVSATLHRKLIRETPEGSEEFARGVIWANENKFPTVYSCVDTAVFDNHGRILVITKADRPGYMLPGGFAEIGGTDEEDAVREVYEETGIEASNLVYVGSTTVEDWRYAGEPDEIRTRLFIADGSGAPVAADDAVSAQWVDWDSLWERRDPLWDPSHAKLFLMVRKHINNGLI